MKSQNVMRKLLMMKINISLKKTKKFGMISCEMPQSFSLNKEEFVKNYSFLYKSRIKVNKALSLTPRKIFCLFVMCVV